MDSEGRLRDLEHAQELLRNDFINLQKLVEVYEQRHQEDREDRKEARRMVPTWFHLVAYVFLSYLSLRGH